MSATVDANVLVYASNASDLAHDPALRLLDDLAAGPSIFYLFWPTIMGYLRIVTHPSILPQPLSPKEALANVEALIGLPHVRTPGEAEGYWEIYMATRNPQDRGNAIPDGHLAALMRQHGVATLYTRDRDFRLYDWIRPVNPFGD